MTSRSRGARLRRLLAGALLLPAIGCKSANKLFAPLPAGGHHVLFIGNSLTYFNDLPGTLMDLAASAGDTIRAAEVAYPDYNLADHVAQGDAPRAIALGGWEYVILQQGPSSIEVNRQDLITSTRYYDERIRVVGGRTALYMVWPDIAHPGDFPRAIDSYVLAAQAVNGLLLPVGAAWQTAWQSDASLPFYSADGLHPSSVGTYMAALVMYERITGHDARLLPAIAKVAGSQVGISEATVRLLQNAAHETNARYPR